jgi:hypothetical protein
MSAQADAQQVQDALELAMHAGQALPALARLVAERDKAREALRSIEAVCTVPRDSMRNRLNDCLERGETILSIARAALVAEPEQAQEGVDA